MERTYDFGSYNEGSNPSGIVYFGKGNFMTFEEHLKEQARIDREYLRERFEKADLKYLQKMVKEDEELRNFLFTKLKDLPSSYRYLFPTRDFKKAQNKTLYKIMKETILQSDFFEVLISRDERQVPLGWFACFLHLGSVCDIGMISFNRSKQENIVFMKDILKKVDEMYNYYPFVSWVCNPENPFIKHYIRAVIKYKGDVTKLENGDIQFFISKRLPRRESNLEITFSKEILEKARYYRNI